MKKRVKKGNNRGNLPRKVISFLACTKVYESIRLLWVAWRETELAELSEFDSIKTFVELDWYVNDFRSKAKNYSLSGDQGMIRAAHETATQGSRILASVRGKIAPLLTIGFELRQEAVPTSVYETWFNLPFLSFGVESKNLQKTQAICFILPRLKQIGLPAPKLRFKLFYLPALPAATTTEGQHMKTLRGFTNINKERVEINVFPPRDYSTIFRNLVHETIHLCLLEESKEKEPATVEAEVKAYTSSFFSKFLAEWKLVEKSILKELENTVDSDLATFSKADEFLHGIMDISKSKAVIETLRMLFDAILNGSVTAQRVTPIAGAHAFSERP